MDVVCLGELLVDLFPAEVGRPLAQVSSFRPVPGGAPANVAVAASRLGAKAGVIGFSKAWRELAEDKAVNTRGFDEALEAMRKLDYPAFGIPADEVNSVATVVRPYEAVRGPSSSSANSPKKSVGPKTLTTACTRLSGRSGWAGSSRPSSGSVTPSIRARWAPAEKPIAPIRSGSTP